MFVYINGGSPSIHYHSPCEGELIINTFIEKVNKFIIILYIYVILLLVFFKKLDYKHVHKHIDRCRFQFGLI